MSAWLDPLRHVLDDASRPITMFVRDDDAGWEDMRLLDLLDVFARHDAPIDLAVIPTALHPGLAAELRARRDASGASIGLHQHGLSHHNHQRLGRKCEFGSERPFAAQRQDLAEGQRILRDAFGDGLDSIFTPPWNRCTADTGAALVELGVHVLSRDVTAESLDLPGLDELVVHVDWFAARHGARLTRTELGGLIADRASAGLSLGLMLHHAVMDDVERDGVDELLTVVCGHPNVVMTSMAELAATMHLSNEEIS